MWEKIDETATVTGGVYRRTVQVNHFWDFINDVMGNRDNAYESLRLDITEKLQAKGFTNTRIYAYPDINELHVYMEYPDDAYKTQSVILWQVTASIIASALLVFGLSYLLKTGEKYIPTPEETKNLLWVWAGVGIVIVLILISIFVITGGNK